jgi:oxygen-dependent protoporphyrinogen oxidase
MGCKDPFDYSTLSLVHVGWNKPLLKHSGYGFLLPSKEQGDILGMTWDSEMFPQFNQGVQTRVTAMVAGIHPEQELRTKTLRALSTYMGITETPDLCWVTQAKQAIPQYKLFHHQTVHQFKQQLPSHCFAVGSGFEGVGVNDVIASAEKFVNEFSI